MSSSDPSAPPIIEIADTGADVQAPPPDVPEHGPARSFGAAKAFLIVAAQLVAQLGAAFGTAVLVALILATRGIDIMEQDAMEQQFTTLLAPSLLSAAVVGTLVAVALTAILAGRLIFDRSPTGIALDRGSARQILLSAGCGLFLAASYVLTIALFRPQIDESQLGPLAEIAAASGWVRFIWALIALGIAPPVEEFLFRGVLFSGLARSWGIPASAMIVTLLFTLLHLTETIHFPPAILAILLLGAATMTARLLTRSLGPPIALHFAYNLVIVGAVTIAG